MRRIVYDGSSFYELDEECIKKRKEQEKEAEDQKKKPEQIRKQK